MELLETFFQLFHIGLVGIIRDGYRLCLQVCVEVLQSLLKTDVIVYLPYSVLTLHLCYLEHGCTDVFRHCGRCTEEYNCQSQ